MNVFACPSLETVTMFPVGEMFFLRVSFHLVWVMLKFRGPTAWSKSIATFITFAVVAG